MLYISLFCIEILEKVVESVLREGRFQFSTPSAKCARDTAAALIACRSSQPDLFHQFSRYLTTTLKKCFVNTHKTNILKKAKMWGMYHQLRTSDSFKKEWRLFVEKSVQLDMSAAFYQYVTHEVFKELIKSEYPVFSANAASLPPLTNIEENALRYVAGYVCRKIHDRLQSSTCKDKAVMILCLTDMNGGEEDSIKQTDAWLNMINRGGLWRVTDEVYQLFVIMEEQLRQQLTSHEDNLSTEKKTELVEALLKNEDLLFQWCFCATFLAQDTATVLLKQVVELYITVRGFAFASSCLEMYKQASKKTLSKKKALRSELNTLE